jgi:phosphatidylserine/phosphatidylglycerophosphate/cardiolipin synthase-like enzyme
MPTGITTSPGRARSRLVWVVGSTILLILGALATFNSLGQRRVDEQPPGPAPALLCGGDAGRTCDLSLFAIEPDDGSAPLTARFAQAMTSIDFAPFALDDLTILQALVDARSRGVRVRVMLDPSRAKAGDPGIRRLREAGVETRSTNPFFTLTHSKFAIVDGTSGLVLTFNSTAAELASRRDFAIEDRNPDDVAFLARLFAADWDRLAVDAIPSGFVVAPNNADDVLTALLHSAGTTLDIYAEKLLPSAQLDAIRAAAARGVHVRILRAPPSPLDRAHELLQGSLRGQSLQILVSPGPRVHAKIMVVDGTTVFLGSENVENNTTEHRRELGIIFDEPEITSRISQVFAQDWAGPRR